MTPKMDPRMAGLAAFAQGAGSSVFPQVPAMGFPTVAPDGSQNQGMPMDPAAPKAGAAQAVAEEGRGTDSITAHVTVGEFIIPVEVQQMAPELIQQLRAVFEQAGVNPDQFVVGHSANSINPETGMPEFGFGKVFRSVAKFAVPAIAAFVAPYALGALAPATFGAAGSLGALATPIAAGLGSAVGTLAVGGNPRSALISGLGAGLGSYAFSGMGSGGPTLGDLGSGAKGALSMAGEGAQSMLGAGATETALQTAGNALATGAPGQQALVAGFERGLGTTLPSIGGSAAGSAPGAIAAAIPAATAPTWSSELISSLAKTPVIEAAGRGAVGLVASNYADSLDAQDKAAMEAAKSADAAREAGIDRRPLTPLDQMSGKVPFGVAGGQSYAYNPYVGDTTTYAERSNPWSYFPATA